MLSYDAALLHAFKAKVDGLFPGFNIRFKNESFFMKVLGFFVSPFNPTYMTDFVTTIGKTVYFPSRTTFEQDVWQRLQVLAHEFVHVHDGDKHWWFSPSYMFPQVLAVIPLLAFGVLAWPHPWLLVLPFLAFPLAHLNKVAFWVMLVVLTGTMVGLSVVLVGWTTLYLLGFALCLVPWPAPWRTKWEIRGYSMTLAFIYWTTGRLPSGIRDRMVEHFVGPNYFYMSWRRAPVERALDEAIRQTMSAAILEDPAFRFVHDFLAEKNLIQRSA